MGAPVSIGVWVRGIDSPVYALGIHWICLGYTLGMPWVYIGYALGIHWICLGYALGIQYHSIN